MRHQSGSEMQNAVDPSLMDGRKASRLGQLWAAWKRIGKQIGTFQARALMTFFYFVILAPFGGLIRCLSDPLSMKPGSRRGWRLRVKREGDVMQRAREQA